MSSSTDTQGKTTVTLDQRGESDTFKNVKVGDVMKLTSTQDSALSAYVGTEYEVKAIDVKVSVIHPSLLLDPSSDDTYWDIKREAGTCNVTEIQQGTKESLECGGRGICDRSSGLCNCFSGYAGLACDDQEAGKIV